MDNLEIRGYRDGDEENIVEFLDQVFYDWIKIDITGSKVDYWEWKFKDNPIGLLNFIVCFSGEKLVGCLADYPREVKLGSESVKCGCLVDAAVHPDFRGRRIYSNMDSLAREEMRKNKQVLFNGIGANPILTGHSERRGESEFPAKVVILARIQDLELHAKEKKMDFSLIEKIGYKGLQKIAIMRSRLKKSSSIANIRLENVESFGEDVDDFWDTVKHSYMFAMVRNRAFLNWRFTDHRNGAYHITVAFDQEKLVGYLVTRINRYISSYPEGYVIDVMTIPGRVDVAERLLRDATRYFDEKQVNVVYYMGVKGRPENKILNRLGYIDARSSFGVSLETFDQGYVEKVDSLKSVDPSQLDYQFSYTDWI